jgi:hypothetical protein
MPTDWIVAAHLFATFAMTGIIWFVQIVHYPMLARLPRESLGRFGVAERGREPKQARGLDEVLRHALALVVGDAEAVLREPDKVRVRLLRSG